MSVTKQFFKYVSQSILGTLGVSCYVIADTFFIAREAGTNGITVLNLALPLYNLIFAIGAMMGIGGATRFAVLRAQRNKEAEGYFSNSLFFLGILSIVFVLVGIFFPAQVLTIMGADKQIMELGIEYFRIFLLFTPFFMMNYVFTAFIRNDGDPALAMVATVVSSLSNVVFDYIFMFPMGMGLAGAALATAASPIISICICSLHFLKKTNTIKFRLGRPRRGMTVRSCQLGVPALVSELSSGMTTMVFNFIILTIAGNIGVAAYGVVANFAIVAVAIFNGISQGAQPLISRHYGIGDEKSTHRLLSLGIGSAVVISIVIYGVVFLFAEQLVGLFNSEQNMEMAQYALQGMRLYFTGFIFAGFNMVVCGYFSATERATGSFIVSIIRGIIGIVAFAFILSGLFGFCGVWMSFPVTEAVTSVIAVSFLVCYIKRRSGHSRSVTMGGRV